jgi:hypothetical protein
MAHVVHACMQKYQSMKPAASCYVLNVLNIIRIRSTDRFDVSLKMDVDATFSTTT